MTTALLQRTSETLCPASAVSALTLTDFRNYHTLKLSAPFAPVVLIGANGAGKTNILEAISLLTPGRGLRTAAAADIDRITPEGGRPWGVHAIVHGREGEAVIGTGRVADDGQLRSRRLVKIDGKIVRGQEALAGRFSAVWLTPQTDKLFTESATERRRFFDRLVYALLPEHAAHVSGYEKASRERSRLLETGQRDDHWLSALEKEMAHHALHTSVGRQTLAEHLNRGMQQWHTPFPKARLSTGGMLEAWMNAGLNAEEITARACVLLRSAREADAASGRVTQGLHRTEWNVWFDAAPRREAALCSTGEQKALLLSLLLTHAETVRRHCGTAPAMLLDEVVAHLDAARRAEFLELLLVLGVQAWLTGTDESAFSGLRQKAQSFLVENGQVNAN